MFSGSKYAPDAGVILYIYKYKVYTNTFLETIIIPCLVRFFYVVPVPILDE